MSMVMSLLGLSSTQIAALRAAPSLVGDLVMLKQDEQHKASLAEAISNPSPETQTQIANAHTRLKPHGPFEEPLDIQKSWHILHYLFTGHVDASPAPGDALLTGEDVGDDLGYGPAMMQDEKATIDFARFLNDLDLDRLQQRVRYREMLAIGVYIHADGLRFGC